MRTEEQWERLLHQERAARAVAEATAQMKDEFLATVSHELRTPLTAVLLWSRILWEGKLSPKERQEAIETIYRCAQAQGEMIEDLLDISRMISGRVRLNLRRMEPASVAQAAVKAAQVMADAKEISIHTEFDPTCGSVRADPVRIQQLVWNLLTHAVRSTPTSGKITVSLRRVDEHVELQVVHSGNGVAAPPPALSHSRTSDAPTRQPGALGLALVRKLVDLHGGTVHADSFGEDHATRITIELPLQPVEEAPPATETEIVGFAPSQLLAGLRIILVEDEADTRNVIRWLLEQSGAEVKDVESAAKAMEILTGLNGDQADVILSDIGIAGENGYDLIRKVRALDSGRKNKQPLPAIAVSVYANKDDQTRAIDEGYQAFAAKPIDPRELVLLVARIAGGNAAEVSPPAT